jgi:transcriptional regulator with XRE-family HTH domain
MTATVGQRITAYRKVLGQSQQRLATAVGVTTMTLASWEKGKTEPRVGQLRQLAELLGVSVTDLIEGT